MKVLYILLFISINCIKINDDSFDKVMNDLENLEKYIKEYIKEKSYTEKTLTHLIVCYIRLGAYSTTEWSIAGGTLPDDLVDYIKAKDAEYGTTAQATQTYRDMVMPNGDPIDFVHMFAVMNGIENGNSYSDQFAHLVGWGGDTEQLLEDIMNQQGDLESLMKYAEENYFRIKGGFDEADLISDLDGPILLYNKNDNNNFADLMRNYYKDNEQSENRVNKFVELTFPNLINIKDKEIFRNELFNIYYNDILISVLECQAGLRDPGILKCYTPGGIKENYVEQQKAAIYVVSDYFYDNYEPSSDPEYEEEESKEQEKEKEQEREKEKEQEDEQENEKEKEQETEKENENEKEETEEQEEEKEGEDQKEEEESEDESDTDDTNISYIQKLNYHVIWICILLM